MIGGMPFGCAETRDWVKTPPQANTKAKTKSDGRDLGKLIDILFL
jgi:hypothetical protein